MSLEPVRAWLASHSVGLPWQVFILGGGLILLLVVARVRGKGRLVPLVTVGLCLLLGGFLWQGIPPHTAQPVQVEGTLASYQGQMAYTGDCPRCWKETATLRLVNDPQAYQLVDTSINGFMRQPAPFDTCGSSCDAVSRACHDGCPAALYLYSCDGPAATNNAWYGSGACRGRRITLWVDRGTTNMLAIRFYDDDVTYPSQFDSWDYAHPDKANLLGWLSDAASILFIFIGLVSLIWSLRPRRTHRRAMNVPPAIGLPPRGPAGPGAGWPQPY